MNTGAPHLPFVKWQQHSDDNVVEINERLRFADNDGFRVVFHDYETPLYRIAVADQMQVRYVAVSLRQSKLATQEEIAAAFGHSVETQRRWERRFEKNGMEALRDKKGTGRRPKIAGVQESCVRRWFKEGVSNREIGRRLGVSEASVRRTLRRLRLSRRSAQPQLELPLPPASGDREESAGGDESAEKSKREAQEVESSDSGESATSAATISDRSHANTEAGQNTNNSTESEVKTQAQMWTGDPLNRTFDRMMARLGLLDDANPIFADVARLPRVGVFLAVPLLVKSGVLDTFQRVYRSVGPAFYGLRTTVLCLFFLALVRIRRPENLKEYDPQDLGRLLGLDRAPEVKTLRRKLARMAERTEGMNLMRELGESRAKQRPGSIGVLYFDGHVREYHGKQKVGKAYVTQRRRAVPAATDTWINDCGGQPVFVVPSKMNEGLTKVLEPALVEVRKFVGAEKEITVIFDRGGWSPKLFHRLIGMGYHIITYRKGHFRRLPKKSFSKEVYEAGDQTKTYRLHDAPRVRVGKTGKKKGKGKIYLWMRQVTVLRTNGRQTAILTDRVDLSAASVAYLMFNRWRQENFFKYMEEEFAIDALLEYGAEPISEEIDRPNPERKRVAQELARARKQLSEAKETLGELLAENEEASRPTVRGFKIANSRALRAVEEARAKAERLVSEHRDLPKRVPASDLVALKRERNLVTDAIKMTAYQIETDLAEMLAGVYGRNGDEGRTLLHAVFQSSGRIEVSAEEIRITLVPQSSPHRTRAVGELCDALNRIGAKFPATDLRLSLAIDAPEPVISVTA